LITASWIGEFAPPPGSEERMLTTYLRYGSSPTETQSADLNATIGSNPTFILTATGTAPLSYQWQMNGVNIYNATNSSYTITDATTKDIGNYRCIISNKYATTYSDYAALDVGTAPSIWTSPISKIILYGK
tara:strand:- start:742 stop:1134 length:393 start_codon:yes stop_codon:yes gene_type:complete